MATPPFVQIQSLRRDGDTTQPGLETIAEEVPVALVYNEISHVVMMATPQDLADFALGFSLTEGILAEPGEIYDLAEAAHATGIEVQLTVAAERFQALKARRRNLTGRTGCGLCGVDSLDEAVRPSRDVGVAPTITHGAIDRAMASLPDLQPLNRDVRALHAAAWASRDGSIVLVREDVGRHNALDKLIGAMAKQAIDPRDGFLVMTSRCSYEIVQKAVMFGIGIVVSVSAPTALAVRMAETSNVTLVASARGTRYNVYARADRISERA
ncbi:formate dehydrogenase accessory sulfurtransferase FdhD [Roseiterribacter gracilis]|uniref:Sulfur carrier protein FdhD n=1 Tax=Roseiterribacter gracilis TaxID=2812848 RepID=A0A8S8XLK8_9PROT|nr:sulfurtransferase FdhD [Rhodospirillales bacterium TMPK1]